MKVVVTGKGGQLASEFEALKGFDPNWTFLSEKNLDITNKTWVSSYFQSNKFDLVINCAAYTAVDKAEDEEEQIRALEAQIRCQSREKKREAMDKNAFPEYVAKKREEEAAAAAGPTLGSSKSTDFVSVGQWGRKLSKAAPKAGVVSHRGAGK